MNVTPEEFQAHYESLADSALLEINPAELVSVARERLAAEITRRGLNTADPADEAEGAAPEATSHEAEEFVCIAEYDHHEEADMARGLLEASEIPASIESEPGVVRLMVPASMADQALPLLVSPLTDEELEAQAAAATEPEDKNED